MRAKLAELLEERPISHPTILDLAEWRGDRLTLTIRGYRWWEDAYSDRSIEGVCRLVFEGLSEGIIEASSFSGGDEADEALDAFEITPVAEHPWAQARDWSIYCSRPIPAPLDVFRVLQVALARVGAFRTPPDFLNQGQDLDRFIEMTARGGFLLAQGPAWVRDLLTAELERQGVSFNLLHIPADTEGEWLVRLDGCSFVCREAWIEA